VKQQASQAQHQLAEQTAGSRQQLASVSRTAKDQVQQQAATAGATISKVTPEPVRRAAAQAGATARRHRVPAAIGLGVAALAALVITRWRRR